MSEVSITSLTNLQNEVRYGANHTFITDEPTTAGGDDAGPRELYLNDYEALRQEKTVAA